MYSKKVLQTEPGSHHIAVGILLTLIGLIMKSTEIYVELLSHSGNDPSPKRVLVMILLPGVHYHRYPLGTVFLKAHALTSFYSKTFENVPPFPYTTLVSVMSIIFLF